MPNANICEYNDGNETWLHNLIAITRYTSWIFGRCIKGFYAHAKAKCLEESIVVFKFYKHSLHCYPRKGHLQQKK